MDLEQQSEVSNLLDRQAEEVGEHLQKKTNISVSFTPEKSELYGLIIKQLEDDGFVYCYDLYNLVFTALLHY